MSFLDLPHIGYVLAAYAVAAIVVGRLIGWLAVEYRALRRALAAHGTRAVGETGLGRLSQYGFSP